MALTPDITESEIRTRLRAFLLDITSGFEVVLGQVNRVPEPKSSDFIIFTPTNQVRLSTNQSPDRWEIDSLTRPITMPTQFSFQLDVHGPNSALASTAVMMTWRDSYAVDFMKPLMAPLGCTDANQLPFVNGENQYEDRWVMTVGLQVNPTLSTPQQFAITLTPQLIEVDTTYPPGA